MVEGCTLEINPYTQKISEGDHFDRTSSKPRISY